MKHVIIPQYFRFQRICTAPNELLEESVPLERLEFLYLCMKYVNNMITIK